MSTTQAQVRADRLSDLEEVVGNLERISQIIQLIFEAGIREARCRTLGATPKGYGIRLTSCDERWSGRRSRSRRSSTICPISTRRWSRQRGRRDGARTVTPSVAMADLRRADVRHGAEVPQGRNALGQRQISISSWRWRDCGSEGQRHGPRDRGSRIGENIAAGAPQSRGGGRDLQGAHCAHPMHRDRR